MPHIPIRNNLIIWTILFCLTQLSGCSFTGKYSSSQDGAPAGNFDASKIPDAVPKNEPLSASGNQSYVERGRRYYVLKSAKGYDKIGTASWYGTKFQGRRTSNNERYNLYSMTAASRVLPIPTYVQVTNLTNGKQVIVKVNDRGPFHGNRLIDVSYAAAKKLGFVGNGTTKVKVTAIDPNNWPLSKPNKKVSDRVMLAKNDSNLSTKLKSANNANKKTGKKSVKNKENKSIDNKLYVQIGSFAKLDNAQKLSAKINKLIATPTTINHKTLRQKSIYEVHIGPLANANQSHLIKQLLEKHGLGKAIVVNG